MNPNLMSRFREEHYATKAHKASVKLQRADNSLLEEGAFPGHPDWEKERRALRSQYFKEKAKMAPSTAYGQRRLAWRDPGFG